MKYRERNETKRGIWKLHLETIIHEQETTRRGNIIYVDESGIDHNEVKSRSWSPIGKPTPSEQYGHRNKRTTLIAWVRGDTVIAPLRFTGSTNTEIFNQWIEESLSQELKPWDVVVLDNASFHKSEKTKILIEKTGAKLLFLPPYSPDFNPIENYWALLKQYVRKYNTSFDIFYQILDEFMSREKWCYLS